MKYILFIGDGMADNPVEELGGITPIEKAEIPNIDAMASVSEVGSVKNVPDGLPAGSDTAILTILGNDIRNTYSGRAPLEAAAMDIFPDDGDTAYRCNIVSIEDGDMDYLDRKILSHSGGSVEGDDALAVMAELLADESFKKLLDDCGMTIYTAPNFRQMAVQKNAQNKGLVLPEPHNHLGEVISGIMPYGCENADKLAEIMRASFEIMNKSKVNEKRRAEGKLPANGLWFWADGTAMKVDNFKEKFNKRGACVSAVPLVQGIAKLMGMDVYLVEGATGEIDTNLEGKVETAIKLVNEYDFVIIHVEAPDECTHNGDLPGKIQSITWLDSRVMTPLKNALEAQGIDFRLLFLSDHKTLTSTRGHDETPVPYMIYDSTLDYDGMPVFCEKEAAKGPKIPSGVTLMSRLFER